MAAWFGENEVCEETTSSILFAFRYKGGDIELHADIIRSTKALADTVRAAIQSGRATLDLTLPSIHKYAPVGYPKIWMPYIVDDAVFGRDYFMCPELRVFLLDSLPWDVVAPDAFVFETDYCDAADSQVIRGNMQARGLIDEDFRPSELLRGHNDAEVAQHLSDWSMLPEKHRGNKLLLRDVGYRLWDHVRQRASIEVAQDGALELYGDSRALENIREDWSRDWPGGEGELRYRIPALGYRYPFHPFVDQRHGAPTNALPSSFDFFASGSPLVDPLDQFVTWLKAPRRQRPDGKWDVLLP